MTIEEAQKDIVDHLRNRYKQSGQNSWVQCDSLKGKLAIPEEIYGKALKNFMDGSQLDMEFSLSGPVNVMRLGKSHVS
ncbi:MAG: hypothetical protein V3T23_13385 [Nitrososphaerales archaeon]